ncbi:MAG: HAMP domain-containing histidine kinase [Lachnospiraceae bacterium]|jgi:signal transduction histidine kinase|nr:HAMP domain-containing histidine kinase [Lachnospiraceae bacterium]
MLKRDIRQINKDLEFIKSEDTNSKLTTQAFAKDVCELCCNINEILDERRSIVIECEKTNNEFKRAITNISHDMRTPLTSAIGYTKLLQQLLTDENKSPTKQAEYIDIIEHRLQSLSLLMDNLFEYAQVIEGKERFETQNINVANILRDTLSEFFYEFEKKGFKVETNIPDEPINRLCDPAALKRVLANLLKNAATHGHKYIRVGLDDYGIEIANKADLREVDVEKIFERFYTADLSRSGKNTGLGLAIARELMTRTGGAISASTEGELLIMKVSLGRE